MAIQHIYITHTSAMVFIKAKFTEKLLSQFNPFIIVITYLKELLIERSVDVFTEPNIEN
jgi:hypothetical protein